MNYANKNSSQRNNSERDKRKLTRFISFALILSFFISSIITPLFANNIFAASTDISSKTSTYLKVSAMQGCIQNIDTGKLTNLHDGALKDYIDESNASNGLWFTEVGFGIKETEVNIGYINSDTGIKSCNSILSDIKSELGYSSYTGSDGLLCVLMNRAGLKRENGTTCETGNGKFKEIYKLAAAFNDVANEKLYSNKGIVLDDAGWYIMYKNTFFKGCGAQVAANQTMPESDTIYINVNTVGGSDASKSGTNYEGLSKNTTVPVRTDLGSGKKINMKCSEVASNINKYVDAYVKYLKANPDEKVEDGSVDETETGTGADEKTTCAIDGVGWVVCPVMNFLATITDTAFDFLASNLLETSAKTVSSGSDSATYKAWKVMRDIANVVFVIAFLIIIFSQLSSFGIDNYGIKKLLPKIIIAAILVNVSFIICQLAVDISNILGYSLKSLFDGLGDYIKTPTDAVAGSKNVLGGATLMAGLLAAGVTLALAISIPVIISALFALLIIVIILLARNALIVLLVVISPLAFVAYLLPNTEEYFTKWRKTFTALLLVFPVISVVFGASALAAGIVKSTADNQLTQVMAIGVALIPLFIVPGLLKKSIDSVGNIGAKISGMGDNIGKNAGNKYANSSIAKHMAGVKADNIARTKTGNYVGLNPARKLRSSMNGRINSNSLYNKATKGYGSQLELARQSQNRSDIKDAVDMFDGDDVLANAWIETQGDKTKIAASSFDLSQAQKDKLQKMRQSGQQNKSASYLGAADMLASSGKSSSAQIVSALNQAKSAGANNMDIEASRESAIANYRKNGRGDNVADLSNTRPGMAAKIAATPAGAPSPAMSQESGWAEISAASVHREGVKLKRDPVSGAVLSESTGATAYRNNLESNSDKTIQALRAYESMDGRAQADAGYLILQAANHHAAAAAGPGAPAPAISSIADAKTYFGITT